jgi:hypothetical protein
MNAKAPLDEYLIFGGSSPDLVKDRVENDILPELMQGLDASHRNPKSRPSYNMVLGSKPK